MVVVTLIAGVHQASIASRPRFAEKRPNFDDGSSGLVSWDASGVDRDSHSHSQVSASIFDINSLIAVKYTIAFPSATVQHPIILMRPGSQEEAWSTPSKSRSAEMLS